MGIRVPGIFLEIPDTSLYPEIDPRTDAIVNECLAKRIGSLFNQWGEVGGFLIGDASGRAGEAGPAPRTARWDGWTPSGR